MLSSRTGLSQSASFGASTPGMAKLHLMPFLQNFSSENWIDLLFFRRIKSVFPCFFQTFFRLIIIDYRSIIIEAHGKLAPKSTGFYVLLLGFACIFLLFHITPCIVAKIVYI